MLAAIYAFLTFYPGVPVMKKRPGDEAVAYTIVVAICAFVLALFDALVGLLTGGGRKHWMY